MHMHYALCTCTWASSRGAALEERGASTTGESDVLEQRRRRVRSVAEGGGCCIVATMGLREVNIMPGGARVERESRWR